MSTPCLNYSPRVAQWIDDILSDDEKKLNLRHQFLTFCLSNHANHNLYTPFDNVYHGKFLADFVKCHPELTRSPRWANSQADDAQRLALLKDVGEAANPFKHVLGILDAEGCTTMYVATALHNAPRDWTRFLRDNLEVEGYTFVFCFASSAGPFGFVVMSLRHRDFGAISAAGMGRTLSRLFRPEGKFVPVIMLETQALFAIALSHVAYHRIPTADEICHRQCGMFGFRPADIYSNCLFYQEIRMLTDCMTILPFQRDISYTVRRGSGQEQLRLAQDRFAKWGFPVDLLAAGRRVQAEFVLGATAVLQCKYANRPTLIVQNLLSSMKGEAPNIRWHSIQQSGTIGILIISTTRAVPFLGSDGVATQLARVCEKVSGTALMSVVPLDPSSSDVNNPLAAALLSVLRPMPVTSSGLSPMRAEDWAFLNHRTKLAEAGQVIPSTGVESARGRSPDHRGARQVMPSARDRSPDPKRHGKKRRAVSRSPSRDGVAWPLVPCALKPEMLPGLGLGGWMAGFASAFTQLGAGLPVGRGFLSTGPEVADEPVRDIAALLGAVEKCVDEHGVENLVLPPPCWVMLDFEGVFDRRGIPYSEVMVNNFLLDNLKQLQYTLRLLCQRVELASTLVRDLVRKRAIECVPELGDTITDAWGISKALACMTNAWKDFEGPPPAIREEFSTDGHAGGDRASFPFEAQKEVAKVPGLVARMPADNALTRLYLLLHRAYARVHGMAPDERLGRIPWVDFKAVHAQALELHGLMVQSRGITGPIAEHYKEHYEARAPGCKSFA